MKVTVVFFGSTTDSIIILNSLYNQQLTTHNLQLIAVITQPPRPIGRKHTVTPTPVETWANQYTVPVLSFATNPEKPWLYENEQQVVDTLAPFSPDLVISASYGQKIPTAVITKAPYGGINIHPSLIPRFRGADPVPWTLLAGDHQTGITVMTLSEQFDEGLIIAQQHVAVTSADTADPLRTKLFTLGAQLLPTTLPDYLSGKIKGKPQESHKASYAGKFTRQDGYVPWDILTQAMLGKPLPESLINKYLSEPLLQKLTKIHQLTELIQTPAVTLERAFRALSPWPGLWTVVPIQTNNTQTTEKRLKILSCHLRPTTHNSQPATCHLQLQSVQLEGKNPVDFAQFTKAYQLELGAEN